MLRIKLQPSCAGLLLSPVLLASTLLAQQLVRKIEPPQSILSLAPSLKPQGLSLARRPSDATFANAPANYHVFAAATVGEDAGVETLTLNFAGGTTLTSIKSKNKDFVVEPGGTCHEGNSYVRGQSCTLLVRFNPQGPGHRLGILNVSNTAEATPMSFGLTGNGYSPVVSFTPSLISTIPSSVSAGTGLLKSATNMTVDGGDIVYVADIGNANIKELDSSGTIVPYTPYFATPQALAVDSLGVMYSTNITGSTYYFSYFLPWGSQTAYGTTYAPGSCTPSATCPLTSVGMSRPANMSIDNYDDLFFEEGTKGAAEMPVTNVSGGTGTFNLWYLSDQFAYSSGNPSSFAADASGNIYTSYIYTSANTCFILEEGLYSAEYSPTANRVAGGVRCGFSGDGGEARSAEISSVIGQIAFDVAGNLYFADAGNQRVRRIDASTGIINTIAGNGTAGYAGDGAAAIAANLSNPTGVAVDSQGQVYILSNAPAAGPTQVLRKVGVTGFRTFNTQLKGTTSAARTFNVANTGNTSLVLSAAPFFTGANPADFAIDPATTSCVMTAGATIAAGRSCNVGIVFKPSVAGARAASLVFQDNTVTGTNTIQLTGTGTLPVPTMAITSPAPGSSVKTGATVTFAVSVTSTATTKPTGTVTFKANGATIGSPVTLSAGAASTTFSEPSASTYTLSAVYSGDANYATATQSESLIVTTTKTPVKINLSPTVNPASACGAMSFSVQVSSTAGGNPTGTVTLTSGSSVLASSTLANGAALLSTGTLAPGAHSFVANYSGDSSHDAATSAPVSLNLSTSCTGVHPPGSGAVR